MNLNTMKRVRQQIWGCFSYSADALCELIDALASSPSARSLPELSLSASFRRKWPSVYEALSDGRVDSQRWSQIWTEALLVGHSGPVWVSVDSTSIERAFTETSADRGMISVPNLPHATKPVNVGWHFSTVMLLPQERSRWGAILSQRRIHSSETAVAVAIEQLEGLRPHLPATTRVLTDRWYVTGPFVQAVKRLHMSALLRLQRNRKLYRPAPPPVPGKRGAPRKDGDLFQGSRPETYGEPDEQWAGADEPGHPIQVQAWRQLHLRQAREVEVTVFRVLRERAQGTKRDPRESWFVGVGAEPLPLGEVVEAYRRRFSHEHTYRFLKQDLLWTQVRVRTPEQFERWSLLVATAMNQLVLARQMGQSLYRPWERRTQVVTPRQVRRMMPAILSQLGTPTRVPKPRGKSPGRVKGMRSGPPPRFQVIRRTARPTARTG